MKKSMLTDYHIGGDIIDQVAAESAHESPVIVSFHDAAEKDEIKRKVDLVALFQSFGVELKKNGTGYIGRCPWHDDTTPSLSVDREKGVYHCFGCGESGDAFTVVQKIKGLGFREALAYLKNWIGTATPKTTSAPLTPSANVSPKVEPAIPPTIDAVRLLTDVCERYEKALAERPEARVYLAGRKLWVPDALKRFRVGYCDGKLADVISGDQRVELVTLGILKENGHEHFAKCVVVPLFDTDKHVVGFYGRRIDEGKPSHLYLPGPHRGLCNREAAKAYRDRLILTEAVLDALSLETLGIQNAIPCYGVNGFTADHERLLIEERVKEVVIAFDTDEAGENGSKTLIERLSKLGIKAYSIQPAKGKDWNEFLQSGGTKDEVEKAIEQAFIESSHTSEGKPSEVLSSKLSQTQDTLVMTKEAGRHIFSRGSGPQSTGVRYRVDGVRDGFSSSLRVSVRAEILSDDGAARSYRDSVELFTTRSRKAFAAACSDELSGAQEAIRIEKDLLAMLDLLEAERDAKFTAGEPGPHVMTPEERAAGMELLLSPNIAQRIIDDLTAIGYVGEDVNKLLMYLVATSRKMPDPMSAIIVSQSASGKSFMIESVNVLMPPEDVVALTSLSNQALNYLAADALMHKFLIMGEAVHSEEVEHQIREMLSARHLSRMVTLKDEKTGEMVVRRVSKDVLVALAMSTTSSDINPENASRCFVISTDESEAQTKAVHARQRAKYSLEHYANKNDERQAIIMRHHAAQRLLESVAIVNPYAHLLDFPARLMRTRRDHERFLDLIASVCFLRQFQKERKENENGGVFVECDLEDYKIAYDIMKAILPSTLSNVPKAAQELYEELRMLAREKAEEQTLLVTETVLTQREIREGTDGSPFMIKTGLRLLVELEYVVTSGSHVRGSRNVYRLVADEPLHMVNMAVIPTPEALAQRMQAEGGRL